jgi:hypothetical protein
MPSVDISFGEFFDKWSILKVKAGHLQKVEQRNRVEVEMNIHAKAIESLTVDSKTNELMSEIYKINLFIWRLMEQLYALDDSKLVEYVEVTLEITEWNKKRAYKKGEIDQHFNSTIREAKSYF